MKRREHVIRVRKDTSFDYQISLAKDLFFPSERVTLIAANGIKAIVVGTLKQCRLEDLEPIQ